MDRRSFLTLFGCGAIALATDWSKALSQVLDTPVLPAFTGRMGMYDFVLQPTVDHLTIFELQRSGPGTTLLQLPVHPRGMYRWVAGYGEGIVVPEGRYESGLSVVDRADPLNLRAADWAMHWQLASGCASVTGCEYCGRAYFDWPAGGHCRSCGGALPGPLTNTQGERFCTTMRAGERETVSLRILDALEPTPDRACAFCGAQVPEGAGNCLSCGAGWELS
jgi:hypothetical protein